MAGGKYIYRHGYRWKQDGSLDYKAMLNNKVSSYWKFDEAGSVTRNDAKGTNHLLVTGSVPSAASGIIGNCADFSSRNVANKLSIAGNASLNVTGVPFAWWFWVKFNVIGDSTGQTILQKGSSNGTTASSFSWRIRYGAAPPTDNIQFSISNGTNISALIILSNSVFQPLEPFATSVWYLVYGYAINNLIAIGYNNKRTNTGALFRTTTTAGFTDSNTFPFCAGLTGDNLNPLGGWIDEVGFIKGDVLTETDIYYIWNAGAGHQYPY